MPPDRSDPTETPVSIDPQYPVQSAGIDELLAALIPDTPAGAERPFAEPARPAIDHALVAELIKLARDQGAVELARPAPLPVPVQASTASGPLVPRWAVGTAVASVGLGAGALLLSYATHLLAVGAAAVAAGISAAAPMLIVGTVLLAGLLGRRNSRAVEVVQTVTQTVRVGGRR